MQVFSFKHFWNIIVNGNAGIVVTANTISVISSVIGTANHPFTISKIQSLKKKIFKRKHSGPCFGDPWWVI